MRKLARAVVVLAVVVGVMAVGPAAFAGGKPETFTEHWKNHADTFSETICVNGVEHPATVSIVESGVFHGTFAQDGTLHITGTFYGTFVADPVDPSLPTYHGRFTGWFGGTSTRR